MSVGIRIGLLVGLMFISVPFSAIAGGGGGTDIERDTVGVVQGTKWILRSSNDSACTTATLIQFNFGEATDKHLSADLDGDGLDQATLFRDSDGFGSFFIRDANESGAGNTRINFGAVGDLPIAGNFDTTDAGDEVAVYRQSNNTFYIQTDSGTVQFGGGGAGDVPVAGNWDNSVDGSDEVGLFRPSTNQFFLFSENSGSATKTTRILGATGDLPTVGDWDGDGSTTIGAHRDQTSAGRGGRFYFNNMTTGGGSEFDLAFGGGTDDPVSGDWDGPMVDEDGCP